MSFLILWVISGLIGFCWMRYNLNDPKVKETFAVYIDPDSKELLIGMFLFTLLLGTPGLLIKLWRSR